MMSKPVVQQRVGSPFDSALIAFVRNLCPATCPGSCSKFIACSESGEIEKERDRDERQTETEKQTEKQRDFFNYAELINIFLFKLPKITTTQPKYW